MLTGRRIKTVRKGGDGGMRRLGEKPDYRRRELNMVGGRGGWRNVTMGRVTLDTHSPDKIWSNNPPGAGELSPFSSLVRDTQRSSQRQQSTPTVSHPLQLSRKPNLPCLTPSRPEASLTRPPITPAPRTAQNCETTTPTIEGGKVSQFTTPPFLPLEQPVGTQPIHAEERIREECLIINLASEEEDEEEEEEEEEEDEEDEEEEDDKEEDEEEEEKEDEVEALIEAICKPVSECRITNKENRSSMKTPEAPSPARSTPHSSPSLLPFPFDSLPVPSLAASKLRTTTPPLSGEPCRPLGDCSNSLNRAKFSPVVTTPPVPLQGCPEIASPLLRYLSPAHSIPLSARDKALALCEQREPILLEEMFTETMLSTATKLGEGAFAEVFGCAQDDKSRLAIKVIPIEGDFKYNDEKQSSYEEILPEMVITRELSLLGEETRKENRNVPHYTSNFVQIERMSLCQGRFPWFLQEAWGDYEDKRGSENSNPDIFPTNQLYVAFSTEDAGTPLEDFTFCSSREGGSILAQVAGALAVAEASLEFEHRDLHWSNVLVRKTTAKTAYFRVDGKEYTIRTHGVRATLLDYTLSRMKQGDCVSYNDLNRLPWLFKGKGDVQFDVYRDMRNTTHSHWEDFHPYTNVLWMNYLVNKISQTRQLKKNVSSRSWRAHFRQYAKEILRFRSAREAFEELFAPGVL